mgnify:FL=1
MENDFLSSPIHDFGVKGTNVSVEARFKFDPALVDIKDVRHSCGCTSSGLDMGNSEIVVKANTGEVPHHLVSERQYTFLKYVFVDYEYIPTGTMKAATFEITGIVKFM